MNTSDSVQNLGFLVENIETSIEQVEPNAYPLEPNTNLTINNTASTIETDPLELPIDIAAKNCGLKPCFVELVRCDNIWKTLQLIRDVQEDGTFACGQIDNNGEIQDEDETESSVIDNNSSSPTQINNTIAPYIKYQPVLNNGNSALNFQFSVKSTRLLYQCHECGKQYSHRSTLREHSERVHNIILPIVRKKSENINNDSKNVQSKSSSDFRESNGIKKEEIPTKSNEIQENSANNFLDDGALLDNVSDTHLSDRETTITENKLYICRFCNRQYKDKYYFNYHLKQSHGTSVAGIRTYNKRNSDHKNDQRSPKKTRRLQQIDQSRDLNVHRCNTCGKHFYDKARLGQHRRKVHGIYATKSGQRNRMNNRFQSSKSNNKKKVTNQLSATSSGKDIQQHVQDCNQKRLHPCEFCEKVYADRQCWKSHLQRVHDIKFASFSSVPRGPKELLCKECNRPYLTKRGLIEHLFTVHGQSLLHQCSTCGLPFQNSDSLVKHALDIHKIMFIQRIIRRTKDRPHKCQVCFTHYGLKKNLIWHLLEAHGIKNLTDLKAREMSSQNSTHNKLSKKKKPMKSSMKKIRCGLRNKMRINYNETNESRSIEKLLLGDEIKNKENVDASEKINSANIIVCFLCQRRCIKIRRHFIEYHKVRHPEALIAQCKSLSSTSTIETNSVKNITISKNMTTSKKKQTTNSKTTKARSYRDINPNRLFEKIESEDGGRIYKCKICPNYSDKIYENLRKHEKQHIRQIIPTPILDKAKANESKKRKSESIDHRDIRRRRRLSDSIEYARTTRATTKLKEEREFRCGICDRLFRNAENLSSHKISCVTYHGENSLTNDPNDARESSDRDSGIGISITIKKKNDSYEIVGREGNDEGKVLNSGELNENVLMSDNSSEAFATASTNKNNKSEKGFTYSKYHRVLKIENAEDIDVDIDLESVSNSSAALDSENNQEVTSSGQADTPDTDCKIPETKTHRIPSLKRLCENILDKIKNNDERQFKCRVCLKVWSSQASLNAHMRMHSKPC